MKIYNWINFKERRRHLVQLQQVTTTFGRVMDREARIHQKQLDNINRELGDVYDDLAEAEEINNNLKFKLNTQRQSLQIFRTKYNELIFDNNLLSNEVSTINNTYTNEMRQITSLIVNYIPQSPIMLVNMICSLCEEHNDLLIKICGNCQQLLCQSCVTNLFSTCSLNTHCPYCRNNILTNYNMLKYCVFEDHTLL